MFIMKFLATLLFVSFLLIQTGKKLNYHDFFLGVCFRPFKEGLKFCLKSPSSGNSIDTKRFD